MIDTTLINTLKVLAQKEKKVKEFKRRVRVKGRIIKKGKTKKGSIKLIIQKADDKYNFVVIKTHKENYALAEKLEVGDFVSVVGISKFRAIICTQLKQLHKMDESMQTTLSFLDSKKGQGGLIILFIELIVVFLLVKALGPIIYEASEGIPFGFLFRIIFPSPEETIIDFLKIFVDAFLITGGAAFFIAE